jgi:hypothetical protein
MERFFGLPFETRPLKGIRMRQAIKANGAKTGGIEAVARARDSCRRPSGELPRDTLCGD